MGHLYRGLSFYKKSSKRLSLVVTNRYEEEFCNNNLLPYITIENLYNSPNNHLFYDSREDYTAQTMKNIVRKWSGKKIIIDNVQAVVEFGGDILIPNFYTRRVDVEKIASLKIQNVFAGKEFTPLRFDPLNNSEVRRDYDVCVFFGGADSEDFLKKFILKCEEVLRKLKVLVITGDFYLGDLKSLKIKYPNILFLKNVPYTLPYIEKSSLFIGAFGTVINEVEAVGSQALINLRNNSEESSFERVLKYSECPSKWTKFDINKIGVIDACALIEDRVDRARRALDESSIKKSLRLNDWGSRISYELFK